MRKDVVNVLHSGTTYWVKDMAMVISGVLWVVLVIFMKKMILGGDSYKKRWCQWSDMHSGTPDLV